MLVPLLVVGIATFEGVNDERLHGLVGFRHEIHHGRLEVKGFLGHDGSSNGLTKQIQDSITSALLTIDTVS